MSVEHWEAFYKGGALATCPTGPDTNYSLDVRDAWVEFFAALADGARVLDVGTGNGAVALIARETAAAAGRHLEVHGSDLARIDPPRQVRGGTGMFEGIHFHPGVATEHLPFSDASFDAVSGQFALEYTRIADALREVFRVLKPGGRARFSMHHADSIVVENARLSLAQANLVLEESRIFRKLSAFVKAEREDTGQARSRARVAETWGELNRAAGQLQQVVATTANSHTIRVTLDALQKLLAARREWNPAQLDREVTRVDWEVRASVRRLQDLIKAAQSQAAMKDIATTASRIGYAVSEPRPLLQTGTVLIAWVLDIGRPPGATSPDQMG